MGNQDGRAMDDPFCPLLVSPEVVGDAVAAGDAAAAVVGAASEAWRDEFVVVAAVAAAAGPVVAMAATAAECLDVDGNAGFDELPDAKGLRPQRAKTQSNEVSKPMSDNLVDVRRNLDVQSDVIGAHRRDPVEDL